MQGQSPTFGAKSQDLKPQAPARTRRRDEQTARDCLRRIWPKLEEKYKQKEVQLGLEALRNLERYIMLNIEDAQWKDHLLALDHLKEGIGLRGYGQKDPLVEYKRESYCLFQAMLDRIDTETIRYLFNFQVQVAAPVEQQLLERRRRQRRGRVAFTKANETA
jgi:preprotein translocase subunit SecA